MINEVIANTGLATVRDKLAYIITTELTNQRSLASGDYKTQLDSFWNANDELNIFVDRNIPLDPSELNGIIIVPVRETNDNGSQARTQVTAEFNIFFPGESNEENPDTYINKTLERVSGVVKNILNSGVYVTLGFNPGFIASRKVTERSFFIPISNDSQSLNGVALTVMVEYDEQHYLKNPVELLGNTTTTGRYTIITDYEVE